MPDADLIERELRQQYPRPSAAATGRARAAVLETTTERSRRVSTAGARRRRRPVLLAAAAVLALAGTGVAIADGLGAFTGGVFNGIGSAHHPRTADDVIPLSIRNYMERKGCTQPGGHPCAPMMVGMRFGTSRRIALLPGGQGLYVFKTTWQGLCFVVGPPPGGEFNCSSPLSRSHPSTVWFYSQSRHLSDSFDFGIAVDGVTAVSFEPPNAQGVTVPVKDNVWTYHNDSFEAMLTLEGLPLTAHFADGGTVVDNCTDCLSRRILRRLGVPESQMPKGH